MTVRISLTGLEEFLVSCFSSAGFGEIEARRIAQHLVEAEATGYPSHGAYRLCSYLKQALDGTIDPGAAPQVGKTNDLFATVDGRQGIGIPAMEMAVDVTIEGVKQHGAQIVGITNCGHTGRIGSYVRRAAEAGIVAFCFGGGGRYKWPNVAPYGGARGVMSTNPIAVGFPAGDNQAYYCDFSTSTIATGKAAVAAATGGVLPEGAALDKEGNPTTSPHDLFDGGCLLPAAGAKGSGLAIMAELLTSALLGTAHEFNWLVFAFSADAYRSPAEVAKVAATFASEVKSTLPLAGHDEVFMPGEIEETRLAQAQTLGVNMSEAIVADLREAARSVGIAASASLEIEGGNGH